MHRVPAIGTSLLLPLLWTATVQGQSEDFGEWQVLFNGRDLSGWIDAKPGQKGVQEWVVKNGELIMGARGPDRARDRGRDICTVEEFGDYELELEYKMPPKGNSGVYLRGIDEIQIDDSEGRVGIRNCGSIFNKFAPLSNPQKPAGEWNKYRILHIGPRITVWHNGVLVQDNVYHDTGTAGSMPRHPVTRRPLSGRQGPLMLQGDHGAVWYRSIRIRRLFEDDGWRPLFNGEDLSGFTAMGDDRAKEGLLWEVADHALTNAIHGSAGHDLWTKEAFGNFLVHYAYRSDPGIEGGNSGFYLRNQWEIQILDHGDVENRHSDGSLYSLYPPEALARHGAMHWNHMDVKVVGHRIWVWQNGTLIHDAKTCYTRTDNHGVPTVAFSTGPFKFQGDHGKVFFTDLHVKPLPETAALD